MRGFQVNRDNLMRRWPRYTELFDWAQQAGDEASHARFGERDWRDLQLLSQLAWMDEEYLAQRPGGLAAVAEGLRLHRSGQADPARQTDRTAGARPARISPRAGCRTDRNFDARRFTIRFCRCSATPTSPASPIPGRRSRSPRSAIPRTRANNSCARAAITNELFGRPPVGLWPSEGSVSDQALWASPPNSVSDGSPRMRACWAAR